MALLLVIVGCGLFLLLAYLGYGRVLSRLFGLDRAARTPAVELRDDADYAPIRPRFLLGQHFSAIAAAGPIVGPILAGAMFGWAPALIWVLLGCVLIGGVHDLGALVASVRHRARSITEVVRRHVSGRAYALFLVFVWISLIYVIVVFTDIVAGSFVGAQRLEDGTTVTGGAIASSSLIYLALPVIMGLLMRYAKLPLFWATLIFLPLVALGIWAGPHLPLDLSRLFGDPGDAAAADSARKLWDLLLLGYCFAASLLPMWLLLQPRGHLGGYFLYAALLGGLLGIVVGAVSGSAAVQYPAFRGWSGPDGSNPLFPVLFVTVACGACSGFHALVASGTTSKQLALETDARPVGYGAMLLEGMVAVVSLCCVMVLAPGGAGKAPNLVYAQGIGGFLGTFGVPAAFAVSFALLAFTTFVYDTLDVSTRLGRYVLEELFGTRLGNAGRWVATALTAGVPLLFVMQSIPDGRGGFVAAWKVFWSLFGASNQLLAALTLLAVTVWLVRTGRRWAWAVTGLPAAFMYVTSVWALARFVLDGFRPAGPGQGLPLWSSPVPWAAMVLTALALVLLAEAVRAFARPAEEDAARS
ncbi:MAG TPA: carbon starvation CstA family protein [Planctomycetota bacterium]|nr:carbon starvation CstA family protein [Planctomycetota bacterium]